MLKHSYALSLAIILPLAMTPAVANAQSERKSNSIVAGPEVCAFDYRSGLFNEFLSQNALEPNYKIAPLRERFRLQGVAEWDNVNREAQKIGFSVFPSMARFQTDFGAPHLEGLFPTGFTYTYKLGSNNGQNDYQDAWNKFQQAENETIKNIHQIPAATTRSHALPIISKFLAAQNALIREDFSSAKNLAKEALQSGRVIGHSSDLGEVLGNWVIAHASYREGEVAEAVESLTRGLAAIERQPQRSAFLGGYKVSFLLLSAEVQEHDLFANTTPPPGKTNEQVISEISRLRDEANSIVEIGRTSFGSPYFDLAGAVPGMQLSVQTSWAQNEALLGQPNSVSLAISTLAATLPADSVRKLSPLRMNDGNKIVELLSSCFDASQFAIDAGDFERAKSIRQIIVRALNEHNAEVIIRGIGRDWDHDDHVSTSSISGLLTKTKTLLPIWRVILANGEAGIYTRQLEQLLTPRLIGAAVDALAKQEEDNDGTGRARFLKAKPLVQAAAKLGVDAFRSLNGDMSKARAKRLERAMALLTSNEVESIAQRMHGMGASWELDEDETKEAKQVYNLIGLAAGSLAWTNANASGEKKLADSIRVALVEASSKVLNDARPVAARNILQNLSQLDEPRPEQSRTLVDTARVIAFVAETLGMDEFDRAKETAISAPSSDQLEARATGEMAAGYLLMPVAARAQQWGNVIKIGEPALAAFDKILNEASDTEKVLLTMAAGPALAANAEALMASGNTVQAAAFADRMLLLNPETRTGKPYDWEEIERIAKSDHLLDVGVRANARSGNLQRAFDLSISRVARASQFFAFQRELIDPSFRPIIAPPRAPYEQHIVLATDAGASVSLPWESIFLAIDASRRTDVGDAAVLRNATYLAGPQAVEAYEMLSLAQGELDSGIAPADYTLKAVTSYWNIEEQATDQERKVENFVDSRERLLGLLPPSVVSLVDKAVTLKQLQDSLDPSEVLLGHFVAEGRIAILAVSKTGKPILKWSPIAYADVRKMIELAEKEFRLPSSYLDQASLPRPTERNLRALYDALIAPVEEEIRLASHIVWSPDLTISKAPILALKSGTPLEASSDFETQLGNHQLPSAGYRQYLGLSRSVSFVPKISLFVAGRTAHAPKSEGALAVGDIDYQGTSQMSLTSPMRPRTKLSPTPNASQVIKNFSQITGAKILSGDLATPVNLLAQNAARVKLFLLYAHGSAASANRSSAIMLSGGSSGSIKEFTAQDVLQLKFIPKLVLLAACNTGSATSASGQPYSGLVMSFLAKGSSAVLTSQQQVDEEATAMIVNGLTPYLHSGTIRPSEALRRVMIDISSKPEFSNPLIWAQFLWVGDGSK